mgnify:CR=1 FL=1
MLRRNKTLSIIMSLCLCLAMLAPVFVAPQAAQAASVDYTAITTPSVGLSDNSSDPKALGKVIIDIPDWRALPDVGSSNYEYLTITLPDGLEFYNSTDALKVEDPTTRCTVANEWVSKTTWQLKVQKPSGSPADYDASIMIDFNKILVKSGSGNLDAAFAGANLFPSKKVTIGVRGSGATNTFIDSVKSIGDGGVIDALIIDEKMAGTLEKNQAIKLKLPAGFTWNTTNATVKGYWGFSNQSKVTGEFGLAPDTDKRTLLLSTTGTFAKSTSTTLPGRIRIENLAINADDNAKYGDIEINVSSHDNNDVTEQDVIVAKYGTYETKVVEGTKEDVVAGQNEQAIGEFYIEEGIAGSLVSGRTVTLELPKGVRWDSKKLPVESAEKSDKHFGDFTIVSNTSQQKIKATVVQNHDDSAAAKLKIKSGKIYVEPGFEGDITIKVAGTAGVTGEVVVANCNKAVTLTAESPKDVVIGQANQKAADIVITENAKGAIMDKEDHDTLVVDLPDGVKFTEKPTVEVTEGDFEIDDTDLINDSNALEITVKYASTKASKIKISGINLTLDRTVPEGKVVAKLLKAVGQTDPDAVTFTGSTALDEGYYKDDLGDKDTVKLSETSAGEVSIATTITPAQAGGNAMFKINSNIYQVNGISKVMDVAPYIKGNRTYVPVRYLAYAIGVAENDVVWDAATSKVTFTKGDKVVELTIGSTTITVNGEAQTMDVAPEIVNSRTMLPARFVAEAFGATVGWDAATGTVLVQQ